MTQNKTVMQRAWEIASLSVQAFGGKKREYLSGALRQAWKETKVQSFTWTTEKGSKMAITTGVKNGSTKILSISVNGVAGTVKGIEGMSKPMVMFDFEGRNGGAYLPAEVTNRMYVKEAFTTALNNVIGQRKELLYKIREWDYVPTLEERKILATA